MGKKTHGLILKKLTFDLLASGDTTLYELYPFPYRQYAVPFPTTI